MKKILVITEVFYPEAGLINDFVLELRQRGYIVDVLTQHPSYPLGRIFDGYTNSDFTTEKWGNSTIYRFKLVEGYRESKIKKILNYGAFVKYGKKVVDKIGRDYNHVLIYQTGPLTLALPGIYMKKKFGTPVTIWTFDIWPDAVFAYGFPKMFPLTAFLDNIIRTVYRNSDNVLVSSRHFTQIIQPYIPGKSIVYAPNYLIDEEAEESALKLNPEKFNFTFTGNISIFQNMENVLLGWKEASLDNAVFNIIGDGSKFEALQNLIEKEQIRHVVLHGRYPSNQIQNILFQSDTLVLPLIVDRGIEKTEPFKLQSYLKAGKPIMGVIGGSGKEIIEDYNLGCCADPSNIQDIARTFSCSIQFAETHKKQVAENAEQLMNSRYNKDAIMNTVLSLIG